MPYDYILIYQVQKVNNMAHSLRTGKLSIALETVDFQGKDFGDKILAIVAAIEVKLRDGVIRTAKALAGDESIKSLEDLIFKYKGIRVKMVTDGELAAILPFYPNKNSIFLPSFFRGNFTIRDQQKIIDNAAGKTGTVDLKNARVGGLFSEGTSILYINFNVLFKTFAITAGEVTAFILHEIGHAFSSCEYSDRFTRTNQVLATASREIFKTSGKKNLEYVFKELKTINKDITIEEVDAIMNGDRVVAGVKWHKFLIDTVITELKNDKYNDNSFEQLSDSFATRHGYGKEIITGLDKLYGKCGSVEKTGFIRGMSYVIDAIILIILPFCLLSMLAVIPLLAILNAFALVWVLYSVGDSGRDGTYDELKQRYVRIRSEMIEFLKDPSISKQEASTVIEQIKIVDMSIASSKDYTPLSRSISNFIFSSNRNAKNDIEYQKGLEAMVSNDLFLMSAQFKTA